MSLLFLISVLEKKNESEFALINIFFPIVDPSNKLLFIINISIKYNFVSSVSHDTIVTFCMFFYGHSVKELFSKLVFRICCGFMLPNLICSIVIMEIRFKMNRMSMCMTKVTSNVTNGRHNYLKELQIKIYFIKFVKYQER